MCRRNKAPENYGPQVCAVVVMSVFGGLVALTTMAAGLWFVIYVKDFVVIVEYFMRDVFWGYASLGLYLLGSVCVEIYGALRRNRRALLACIVLLVGLLACEMGVWAFMYLNKETVSADVLGNLKQYCCERCLVRYYVDQTFTCSISTVTNGSTNQAYENCSININQWFSSVMWTVLGLGVVRMALEALLLLLTAMLRYLLHIAPHDNKVVPSDTDLYEDDEETNTNSSIVWTLEDITDQSFLTNGSYTYTPQKTVTF